MLTGDIGKGIKKRTLKDFQNDPAVRVERQSDGSISYEISLYHYLHNGLEVDDLCTAFNRKPVKNWDSDIYGVSDSGEEWLNNYGFKVGRTFNSYNGDSSLSQVIQGTWLDFNGREYLLLQIHQGCDVRGGYTDARLFYCPEFENGALSEDVYGTVTRANGDTVQVSNSYNGYSITDDNTNEEIILAEGDRIELNLNEV